MLVLATFALYATSINLPLLHMDDVVYLFQDPRVARLSLGNLWRILTGSYLGNYHPVTTLTFAVDRAVWGGWLAGFHLTQLAFYAGGVVVLYYLFAVLLGDRPAGFAAAAVYAAHAIHVESVAWLASRKDVVCLLFYAAAILAYVRYARQENWSWKRYAVFAALAVAAMFAKGYAVVLPVVLLAYDACFGKRIGRRQLLDKLPLLAIGFALTMIMIAAQEKDAVPVPSAIGFWQRSFGLCQIFAAYVGRALVPARLSIHYVVDFERVSAGLAFIGALLGVGAVGGFFALRRRLPAAAFGLALFVLQIGTVLNTFFTLRRWMADRYLFFPTIGSTLALASGCLWLYRAKSVRVGLWRRAVPAAAAATFGLYAFLTVARIGVWKSSVGLWSDAVRKQFGLPGSGPLKAGELAVPKGGTYPLFAIGALSKTYASAGDDHEAQAILSVVRQARGGLATGDRVEIARRDLEAGRYDEVIGRLTPLAERRKWFAPVAWELMGAAYEGKGDLEKARTAYRKSLDELRRSGRSGVQALLRLGTLELNAGRPEEAAPWLRRAREEADPADPRPPFFLSIALERTGQVEKAYGLCNKVMDMESSFAKTVNFDFSQVYFVAGLVAERLGRREEAVRHFEEVLRRVPDHPQRDMILAKVRGMREGAPAP